MRRNTNAEREHLYLSTKIQNMSTQLTLVICRGYSCNKTSPFVKESVYIWPGTAKARRFSSPAVM